MLSCPYTLTFLSLTSLDAFNSSEPDPHAGSYILSFSFGSTNFASNVETSAGV